MEVAKIKELMRSGDIDAASSELKKLLDADPEDVSLKLLYGTCCRLLGDVKTCARIDDEVAKLPEEVRGKKWQKYHALRVAACAAAMLLSAGTVSVAGAGQLYGAAPMYGISCKSATGKIYFQSGGGSGSMSTKSVSVNSCSETSYTLPDCSFKRSGYDFVGWRISGCCFDSFEIFYPGEEVYLQDYMDPWYSETMTVYFTAVWKLVPTWPASYRTSFSAGDLDLWADEDEYGDWVYLSPVVMDPGGAPGSQRLYENFKTDYYPAPACPYTRDGYRFAGWKFYSCCYAGDSSFFCKGICCGGLMGTYNPDDTLDVCGVSALVATWEAVPFTVYFDANGGSCSTSSKSVSADSTYGTLPTPTRTGYTFDGWYTDPSGGSYESSSSTIYSNSSHTLYAHWRANSYTVAFNANGGSGSMSSLSCTYDASKTLTANGFTRTGYTFAGWATSSGGSVVYSNGASVKNLTSTSGGTVTLYAKWTANTYTIKFSANGGSGKMADQSCTYDSAAPLSVCAFTRTGYEFLGWASRASDEAPAYTDAARVKNLTSQQNGIVTLYAVWGGPVVVDGVMTGYIGSTPDVLYLRNDISAVGDGALKGKTLSALVVHAGVRSLGANVFEGCTQPVAVYFLGNAPAASSAFFAGAPAGSAAYVLPGTSGWSAPGSAALPSSWPAGTDGRSIADHGPAPFQVSLCDRGTVVATQAFSFGDTYAGLPDWTRDGYAFAGWSRTERAADLVDETSLVTNVTPHALQAQWTANAYTVRCHQPLCLNASDETVKELSCVYDVSRSLPATAPTGYSVSGWSNVPDGAIVCPAGSAFNLTAVPNATVDLYARYVQTAGTLQILLKEDNSTANPDVASSGTDTYAGVSFPRSVQVNGDRDWRMDLGNPLCAKSVGKTGLCTVKFQSLSPRWQSPSDLKISNDGSALVQTVRLRRANVVSASVEAEGAASGTVSVSPAWKCGAQTYSVMGQSVDGSFVTLSAKAAAGSVFAYWRDAGGNVFGCAPTLKVAPTEDTVYTAVFRAKDAPVEAPEMEISTGESGLLAIEAGEEVSIAPSVAPEAWPLKFTAKNLPKGLKIDASTGVVSGTPTVPGEYEIEVVATSAIDAKKSTTASVSVKVANFTDPLIPVEDAYGPYMVGVAMSTNLMSVVNDAKVSGLPAGLKYDAKTGILSGVPTKAGAFTVYFKKSVKEVNGLGKTVTVQHQASATFRVPDLPAWAQGAFVGSLDFGDGTHGYATLSVGKNGKLSGKVSAHGQNWTFASASYDASSRVTGETNLVVRATAKSGKETAEVSLNARAFLAEMLPEGATGELTGMFADAEVTLLRNVWKDKAASAWIVPYAGAYTATAVDGTPISVTVDEKGVAKAAATFPDGHKLSVSTDVLVSQDDLRIVLYAAPNLKNFVPEFHQILGLIGHAGDPRNGVAFRNPGLAAAAGGSGSGTVAMNPKYGQPQTGKPVTATAKPQSDSVFVRWEDVDGNIISYASALSVEVDDRDVAVTAVFRPKSEYARVPTPFLTEDAQERFRRLRVGVAFDSAISVDEECRPVVFAAKNLPAGLKLDKNTGVITGVPTKPGSVSLVVTATCGANAKLAGIGTFNLEIASLDAWSQGTFNGGGDEGQASLTITAAGKIGGKWLSDGLTWSLNAAAFDAYDETTESYHATVIAQSGKLSSTNEIVVTSAETGGKVMMADVFEAYQNVWTRTDWKPLSASFVKAPPILCDAGGAQSGEFSLKFASSGAVTVAGAFVTGKDAKGADVVYKASGTAVLCPLNRPLGDALTAVVFVYFPPKGAFKGYVSCLELEWDGVQFKIAAQKK